MPRCGESDYCASVEPRLEAPAPPAGGRQDALELGEIVERPLGQHGAARVQRNRVVAPGNAEVLPGLGIRHLVEHLDGEVRLAAKRVDGRSESAADVAALRGEQGEADARGR